MPTMKLDDVLTKRLEALGRENRLKGDECVICGVIPAADGKGPRYLLEGEGETAFLRMNSNSYLGMSFRPSVIAAEDEAARSFGTGPGAVRFISGTWSPHVRLERRLAAFHGREAAMLFSSAYATVMGTLPPLISDRTAVISDELNHNCIINAIALARPGEKHIYRHLDIDDLERRLEQARIGLSRTNRSGGDDAVEFVRKAYASKHVGKRVVPVRDADELHPEGAELGERGRRVWVGAEADRGHHLLDRDLPPELGRQDRGTPAPKGSEGIRITPLVAVLAVVAHLGAESAFERLGGLTIQVIPGRFEPDQRPKGIEEDTTRHGLHSHGIERQSITPEA